MKYIYPDINDSLTIRRIQSLEPYPGYWDSSERLVLERIRAKINSSNGSMLDAGCGEGRLLPVFADLFESIVAIELDATRLAKAIELIEQQDLSEKVTFENTDIESFITNKKFDFVLCSHIIQHVHTAAVPRILHSLNTVLASGGRLAIMTNHSTTGEDYFKKNFLDREDVQEQRISLAEFNELVTNQNGILPIHYFTKENLGNLLKQQNLTATDFFCFHCFGNFGELDEFVHRDLIVNALPELQAKFGRDIYIEALKV